ncbi:MAG TPA: hypothetical protein VGW76_06100 [Pyrinomonadaceae bacterium]|nr:hypothetical protein [Pyrinomonadaceae bacterium]
MKPVFRSHCAIAAFILLFSVVSYAQAQTASATPDPFVAQLTSSPKDFNSYVGDISANGRFVVFQSNGDVATEKIPTKNPDGTTNPSARNNEDGNREIFLIDYAQRRIFQITNTRNVQKIPASPTPTPTPTPTPSPGASPTPTPVPTPPDLTQVKIEISNNRPVITLEPALVSGKRIYTIVFSSNAPDPRNFDGADSAALTANANQELWIYQLPAIDDQFDLTAGDEIPFEPLAAGTFRQITDTTPSRPLLATVTVPDVIDDNREATISDDGNTIAFISNRNHPGTGTGNADANPELFFCRTTGGFLTGTLTFAQATSTQDTVAGISDTLQQNPSLSADGLTVAFLSRANLAAANDDKNAEIYVADFTGSALANIRQITKTKVEGTGAATLNVLSPGRRLSRDAKSIVYESRAEDPTANTGTNTNFHAIFVADVPLTSATSSTAKIVGPRGDDVSHFPMFTDYDSALAPHSLVFASILNFKSDGTLVGNQDTTGLNSVPSGLPPNQIFVTQVPVTSTNTFARLTKNPVPLSTVGIHPFASSTLRRITFSLQASELGGGNADGSTEVFYLLTPAVTTQAPEALSFFTGASNWGPFASASPAASPTPTPGLPAGLAPGELSIVQSTVGLAVSDKSGVGGSETARSPILPIELNGVSVSVNGAAAGLYFVGDSASEGIRFVTPIGLSAGVATVVVNNGRVPAPAPGTAYRGFVQIVPSQPDIFTVPVGPGGTAVVCNVTNTASGPICVGPFQVTTADSTGTQVPTRLQIQLTGVRFALTTETKVSFVNGATTTDVVPTSVGPNTNMFGMDFVNITLPASLAGAASINYKLIVTVTKSSGAIASRPADTAPQVTIIP